VAAAERAARSIGGFAAVFAASARALLGLARDDPGEARRGADLALAVSEIDNYDDPAAFWWRPLQVWSLIMTGDLDEAETNLTSFASRAAARKQHPALAQAAWLRGSLARARGDLEQAELVLRKGRQAMSALALPFWRGLLDLEHGRCLARMQRRVAADDALRAARDRFGALGARPFLEAASSEIESLGLHARPGMDQPALTGQEQRVVRLVASGLSNREAAAQLYLSPKTVEYHLAHAFTKLGVRSRHQLIARVARDNPGVPIWGKAKGNS
jgi:DNA-binding CsgD family transcriptional regulator